MSFRVKQTTALGIALQYPVAMNAVTTFTWRRVTPVNIVSNYTIFDTCTLESVWSPDYSTLVATLHYIYKENKQTQNTFSLSE